MAATEGQIRWTTEQATKDFNNPIFRFAGSPTLEQVIEHYLFCQEACEGKQISPRAREWWGLTHEQIIAKVETLNKASRKRNGLRALKAKLGKDGAEDYISWKAGRRINLK
jgi:hypothetical protein